MSDGLLLPVLQVVPPVSLAIFISLYFYRFTRTPPLNGDFSRIIALSRQEKTQRIDANFSNDGADQKVVESKLTSIANRTKGRVSPEKQATFRGRGREWMAYQKLEQFRSSVRCGEAVHLVFNNEFASNVEGSQLGNRGSWEIDGSRFFGSEKGVFSLTLDGRDIGDVKLINCCIPHLNVSGNGIKSLKLVNCNIGLINKNSDGIDHFYVENSHIAKLEFSGTWGKIVRIRKSFIGRLRFKKKRESGLFEEIHVDPSSRLCCKEPPGGLPEEDLPWRVSSKNELADEALSVDYRYLKEQSEGRADELSHRLIYAELLRIERARDGVFLQLLHYAFDAVSAYGTSPLRSIFVIVGLVLATTLGLVAYANMALPVECTSTRVNRASQDGFGLYRGWHGVLCEADMSGEVARAVVASLQSITNPLGVFSYRSLYVVESSLVALWLAMQSVLGVILIFLAIVGIRRRFQLA